LLLVSDINSRGEVPVALKIVKSARHYREAAQDEIHILQTLANADPQNKNCVLRLLDNFDVSGVNGTRILAPQNILAIFD
jgi:serine/threonine-protein kinase SRPK3